MIVRIVSILFPVFALVALGYFYGRKHASDMSVANRLNMHVFTPALIFAGLSTKSYDLATYGMLAFGMLIMVLGSGVVAWVLARSTKTQLSTLALPLMFNNGVNLGVPLAILTFGSDILPLAILLFVVSALLHFSLGIWLLDHHARIGNLWRNPVVLAAIAGFAVGAVGPRQEPRALGEYHRNVACRILWILKLWIPIGPASRRRQVEQIP